MADMVSKEKRSEMMSKIRGKETTIEVMVRKFLFKRGLRYRKNDKRYPGSPDIVLPKYRTIIFIHGCFWHGHNSCKLFRVPKTRTEFWTNKINRNIERDRTNIEKLISMGWKVIIIWECSLRKNPEIRLNLLLNEIKEAGHNN
jgi:DNA mismatch endonuclease, patch repair protein